MKYSHEITWDQFGEDGTLIAQHCETVTVDDASGDPIDKLLVDFLLAAGPHATFIQQAEAFGTDGTLPTAEEPELEPVKELVIP
jgi:hypothetical protein